MPLSGLAGIPFVVRTICVEVTGAALAHESNERDGWTGPSSPDVVRKQPRAFGASLSASGYRKEEVDSGLRLTWAD